jgi:threonine/homoserine/homoserine lactone efflux protein
VKLTALHNCTASVMVFKDKLQAMTAAELTALLALTTASSFSPGPNTTLSTAIAANYGLKRAMQFAFAVPVGWVLLFSLCAGGLGAAVVAVPALRFGIKAVGVAYLLWLAFKLFNTRQLGTADTTRLNVTFGQGVMLQFLNIKAWMLALTVVAGWLAGQADATARFLMILPILAAYAFVSNFSYAVMGSLLRDWLQQGKRLLWFNRFMALVLVVTAAWMATF